MFTKEHYVPILKGKKGEMDALTNLSPESKKQITPLIEVPPISWNYKDNKLQKTMDSHLSKFGEKLLKSWGKDNIFIDGKLLQSLDDEDGSHALVNIFNQCRDHSINSIPTTGLNRDDDYQNAVHEICHADSRGVCLRLKDSDFQEELSDKLNEFCGRIGVSIKNIDIIIDLENISANHGIAMLRGTVSLLNMLPNIDEWRTLTIAGSAFPINLSDFVKNTESYTPRAEWALWKSIIKNPGLKRLPSYGDYGISHPIMPDIDPRQMTISASIRYTCDNDWLILKGQSTKARFGGFSQYYDKCELLVDMADYSGADFSWGDKKIEEKSEREGGTGNPTTWRAITTNHHIEKVINQISSFFAP